MKKNPDLHKIQELLKKRESAWDMGIRQVRYNLPTKDFHNKYMSADVKGNKSSGVKSARSRSKNKNNSLLESLVKDEPNQN